MFAVTATLIGEERTCVTYERTETYRSGGKTYHRRRTYYARNSNRFLSTKLNLYNGMGGVGTDLHLPFEFLLPNRNQGITLPSTMSDPFRSRDSCSVEYCVLLQVQLFGNQQYEHRIPFVVTNSPPPKNGPITVPPTTELIAADDGADQLLLVLRKRVGHSGGILSLLHLRLGRHRLSWF